VAGTARTERNLVLTLAKDLSGLDWNDLPEVEKACDRLLTELDDDRALLRTAADAIQGDAHLQSLCEHYDILDKLVLHDDPSGFRVRLHVFAPGHYDRPHNHRWTYAARILTGSYRHTLYGTEDGFDESVDVGRLRPRMVRTERAGSTYTLHHSMVHAAVAEPYTVSLIVRGPAVKDRFLVTDRDSGEVWWQHGAATESARDAAAKRMDRAAIAHVVGTLAALGVF